MNAVNEETLLRIYGRGKRQRKYVSKISESAQELADLVIAAAVSIENSQGVYWISFTEDDGVTDCEIRQSDNIMSISMISLGASPAMWPRNYYAMGKKLTEYIVKAIEAKMPAKEQSASETPQASELSFEALEQAIHPDKAELASLRNELEAEKAKNEALEAWKNGALVDFKTIADKAKRIYNGDLDMQTAQALASGIYTLSRLEEALQAPVDAVTTFSNNPEMYDDFSGHDWDEVVTLTKDEIEWLVRNTGDNDYEFTAPSILIPSTVYPKLVRTTNFTIFANHYELDPVYNTAANRNAIDKARKEYTES